MKPARKSAAETAVDLEASEAEGSASAVATRETEVLRRGSLRSLPIA